MFMKTISMLELRQDARKVLAALKRGERLLLTYRGKPVARLEPVQSVGNLPEDDPIFRLEEFAVDGPGGGDLTNEEIDRIVYGL
jgi:antitoxin (DNA-binding transcriptional repressor) of toxin-antitoxin stability system